MSARGGRDEAAVGTCPPPPPPRPPSPPRRPSPVLGRLVAYWRAGEAPEAGLPTLLLLLLFGRRRTFPSSNLVLDVLLAPRPSRRRAMFSSSPPCDATTRAGGVGQGRGRRGQRVPSTPGLPRWIALLSFPPPFPSPPSSASSSSSRRWCVRYNIGCDGMSSASRGREGGMGGGRERAARAEGDGAHEATSRLLRAIYCEEEQQQRGTGDPS